MALSTIGTILTGDGKDILFGIREERKIMLHLEIILH